MVSFISKLVWSWGMTVLEVMKESSPCAHLTNQEFGKLLENSHKFIDEISTQLRITQLSEDVSKLILKCLNFERDLRPSFREIVSEMELLTPSQLPTKDLKKTVEDSAPEHVYEPNIQINDSQTQQEQQSQFLMQDLARPYENVSQQ